MPPQKLGSKIDELSEKISTKFIFPLFDIISRMRLYWDFSKKSGVSLTRHSRAKFCSNNVGNVVFFDILGQNFAQKCRIFRHFALSRRWQPKCRKWRIFRHLGWNFHMTQNIRNVVLFDIRWLIFRLQNDTKYQKCRIFRHFAFSRPRWPKCRIFF